jgi:hypothetical protein
MTTCQYGSKKRDGAKDFINPNDIGVLCSLFGLEGGLCRLLDLVPSAIKKIASLNPDTHNSDEVFGDILKKFAKKSYQLVIDELTGQINVEAFCSIAPPPLPEQITYYDVYQFFGDLVPFVNNFLKYNDVLIGNNTKLLDKIVSNWLYKQWFENCECKSKAPTPDNPNPPQEPTIFDESCPVGSSRQGKRIGGTFGETLIINGQVQYSNYAVTSGAAFAIWTIGESIYVAPFPEYGYQQYPGPIRVATSNPNNNNLDCFNTVNGERVPAGTLPQYQYPPCISESIEIQPPAPPEFCDLFPDDPFCKKGCTNPQALNYDPSAAIDDGSCQFPQEIVYGCTNPQATNYNPLATVDDGSCVVYGCTDPNALNYNSKATIDDGSCTFGVLGCTDPKALNYNSQATIDDGSCKYSLYGCRDSRALNYNPDTPFADNSICIYPPESYGCTDPDALNYNEAAFINDGSCTYPPAFYGCIDPKALNYNPNARIDDGSCVYKNLCKLVAIAVVEFSGCDNPRTNKTVELWESTDAKEFVQVVEFSGCDKPRTNKTVELMRCNSP